jgi:FKBP-type peptidyl-prolyl cis-trans isomerase 2
MAQARQGDTVQVHYTGRLQDGTVFDDSIEGEPLQFVIGKGDLLAAFEAAIVGMEEGAWKTIAIPAQEAYGTYRPEMAAKIPRTQLPPDLKPVIGQQLQVSQDEEQMIIVTITAFDADSVTIDANHPLAGKDLIFEVKLVKIVPSCGCCR